MEEEGVLNCRFYHIVLHSSQKQMYKVACRVWWQCSNAYKYNDPAIAVSRAHKNGR